MRCDQDQGNVAGDARRGLREHEALLAARPAVVYNDAMRIARLLALALLLSDASHAATPSVVLVVIDGLGAQAASKEALPRLAARAGASGSTWTSARGVLPARTNPNHASILTGRWPEGHGIVGNTFFDVRERRRRPMDDPNLLEGATIVDVLALDRPDAEVAIYFSKPKLRRLFGAAPGTHAGPTRLRPGGSAYADDAEVFGAAIADVLAGEVPSLLVIGAADVDRFSHADGPKSPSVREAIARVDDLVADLVSAIERVDAWDRTVVVLTADHGFAPVAADGVLLLPAEGSGDVTWIDEGRVAFGYAPARPDVSVLPPSGVPRSTVEVRTDLEALGLRHARAGTVMLMAPIGNAFGIEGAGYAFRGDHGGSEERAVPFIVVGGDPRLRPLPLGVDPDLPDLGVTIAGMLGVRSPCGGDPPPRCGRRLPIWDSWADHASSSTSATPP